MGNSESGIRNFESFLGGSNVEQVLEQVRTTVLDLFFSFQPS